MDALIDGCTKSEWEAAKCWEKLGRRSRTGPTSVREDALSFLRYASELAAKIIKEKKEEGS